MEFDLSDKNDPRITDSSAYALALPGSAEAAPEREGVYVLINGEGHVVCVGTASGTTLKKEIKAQLTHENGSEAEKYRWFVTRDGRTAESLATDWIRKYCI
jgi:hypothetical protein